MTSPTSSSPSRWPIVVIFGVFSPIVLFIAFLIAVVFPRACATRKAIVSLHPGSVRTVEIESRNFGAESDVLQRRVLDAGAAAEFSALLARAHAHFVKRAIDGPRCDVKLVSDSHPGGLHFSIHLTTNQGVLIRANSGGPIRWNYGTLRCDELGPFVATLFQQDTR